MPDPISHTEMIEALSFAAQLSNAEGFERAEGIAGRRGYDPAALTAAEHIEANIHALASPPAPQEETR